MTGSQVIEVADKYAAIPEIAAAAPARDSTSVNRGHIHWMCLQIPVFVHEQRIEKAMRWLGFVQGALWALGLSTVEEMKRDNKPLSEGYDGARI